jgi:HSP20 family protein
MKKQELQAREERKPTIRDRVDRLFRRPLWDPYNSFWSLDPLMTDSAFGGLLTPNIDVSETNKEIRIKADVPGYKPEDISVEMDENILTIRGKVEEAKEEKDEEYIRQERSFGEFQRSLAVPQYADMEKIDCECKNGVLEIIIPKKESRSKAKRIDVKSK